MDLQGIDDGALGAILILGGLLAIGLSLYLAPPRWRRSTVVHERPATTVRERRVYEDEPPL